MRTRVRFTALLFHCILALAIDHGRRRILHDNVTEHPTARWLIQQLRETFPDEPTHRFIIYDNDSIFSPAVSHAMESFGVDPKRTAFRSPWQNGTAERVHTSMADTPVGRPVESRPWEHAKVIGLPRVGGLHHRYGLARGRLIGSLLSVDQLIRGRG